MGVRLNVPKGTTFGRLTVVKETGLKEFPSGQTARMFLCECSCSDKTKIEIKLPSLRSGNTTSCGCVHKENLSALFKTHGLSKHRLYFVWCNMHDRCYNPKNKRYKDYGAKGIKVSKSWHGDAGLQNFITWNANLPKDKQHREGLELDRKNNDKGYKPTNCRWVTSKENGNNRSTTTYVVHKSKKVSFKEFYNKYSTGRVSYSRALQRLKEGHSAYEAIV